MWCRGDAMTFEGVVLYVSACRCPMDGFPVYRVLRDGEAEGPPGFELCESVLEPVVGDRSGVDP